MPAADPVAGVEGREVEGVRGMGAMQHMMHFRLMGSFGCVYNVFFASKVRHAATGHILLGIPSSKMHMQTQYTCTPG